MNVNWKKLSHNEGVAVSLPDELDAWLVLEDAKAWELNRRVLGSKLVGAKNWFTASGPAIELLLSKLEQAPKKWTVLELVANMVGADHVRAWLSNPRDSAPVDVVAAVERNRAILFAAAEDEDPVTRSCVPLVLAMMPSLAEETVPLLERLLDQDKAANVQASAILALARLGEGNQELKKKSEALAVDNKRQPLVRGAAAVALLRMDKKRSWDDLYPALGDWLCWNPGGEDAAQRLPWFWEAEHPMRLEPYVPSELTPTARIVVQLAKQAGRGDELIEPLVTIAEESDGTVGPLAVSHVLREVIALRELCGDDVRPERYVALPSELSPGQLKLAKRIVGNQLFPGGGWGMAAAGPVRARWLGEASPSPLESEVTAKIGRKKRSAPAWALWRELDTFEMPDFITKGLSPLERYLVRVEQLSESYGRWGGCEEEIVEKELVAALEDSRLPELLAPLAESLIERQRAVEKQRGYPDPFPAFIEAVGVPLVRAGKPFPEEWEFCLTSIWNSLGFELFDSMPEHRRLRWFRERVLPRSADTIAEFYSHIPTSVFVESTLAALEQVRETDSFAAEQIEDMLMELGEKDEELAALLPEFDC